MGCPSIYYKRVLQCFAYALVFTDDKKLAEELSEEESEEKLEKLILDKKETCDIRQFYYYAGRSCQQVLNEVDTEGCDALNACICGLGMFDNLIGLRDDGLIHENRDG